MEWRNACSWDDTPTDCGWWYWDDWSWVEFWVDCDEFAQWDWCQITEDDWTEDDWDWDSDDETWVWNGSDDDSDDDTWEPTDTSPDGGCENVGYEDDGMSRREWCEDACMWAGGMWVVEEENHRGARKESCTNYDDNEPAYCLPEF